MSAIHEKGSSDIATRPPAYTPNSTTTTTTEDEPPLYADIPAGPSPYPRLPLSLTLLLKKSLSNFRYELTSASDPSSTPLFTLKSHTTWSASKAFLVLSAGPEGKGQLVAMAHKGGLLDSQARLSVPGRTGGADETIVEELRCDMAAFGAGKRFTFTFGFDVPVPGSADGALRREVFEWRSSRGAEVKALDKFAWGWKLVRLGPAASEKGENGSSTIGKGGSRTYRGEGETSDGKEIVAVWSENSAWSMTKVGRFQFMGAGAEGVLGEEWAFMAMMSALRIWDYLTRALTTGQ